MALASRLNGLQKTRRALKKHASRAKAQIHSQRLNGTAEQAAEKLAVALDFGWRSGSPLR